MPFKPWPSLLRPAARLACGAAADRIEKAIDALVAAVKDGGCNDVTEERLNRAILIARSAADKARGHAPSDVSSCQCSCTPPTPEQAKTEERQPPEDKI